MNIAIEMTEAARDWALFDCPVIITRPKTKSLAKEKNEVAESEIKQSSYLCGITPYIHLTGASKSVTAELPDGSELPLIQIDDRDFNWQTTYRYRELQLLPAGTKDKLAATFEGSAVSPNDLNSPSCEIGWGEMATDEMCIAFLGLVHQSADDVVSNRQDSIPAKVAAANP